MLKTGKAAASYPPPLTGDEKAWRRFAASDGSLLRQLRDELDIAVAAFRVEKIPELSFSLFRRFHDTGDRLAYEDAYFSRRRRLVAFGLRYLIYREKADLAALENILWSVCDEYTWALPAHLGGDKPLNSFTHRFTLDLFACETAWALAEIIDLVGLELTPLIAERVRNELCQRALNPFLASSKPFTWEESSDNWAAVCASSIGAAALYLSNDRKRLHLFLDRLLPTLRRFIANYSDDGVCLEGLSYWTYGFGFFVAFSELLRERTENKFDLLNEDPKIALIARFQQSVYLTDTVSVSFSDASSTERFRQGLSAFLESRFPGVKAPPAPLAAGLFDDPCARWCLALRDFWWLGTHKPPAAILSGGAMTDSAGPVTEEASASYHFFPTAEWFVKPASRGLAFAAKGGHNAEPHNHNDIGAFILAAYDDIFILDIGAGEYTKAYFSDERYHFFVPSSLSHSVPIISDQGQSPGPLYRAEAFTLEETRELIELSMDLAQAYDIKQARGIVRRFSFASSACLSRVYLRDHFFLSLPEARVLERFISPIKPDLSSGSICLRGKRGSLLVEARGPLGEAILSAPTYRDHLGRSQRVYCIDFPVRSGTAPFVCEFVFHYEAEPLTAN